MLVVPLRYLIEPHRHLVVIVVVVVVVLVVAVVACGPRRWFVGRWCNNGRYNRPLAGGVSGSSTPASISW